MLLLLSLTLLGACANSSAGTSVCTGWRRITVSKADVLTDETARQILAHGLYGAAMGCWGQKGRP